MTAPTRERDWLALVARLDPFEVTAASTVVVAPHPDDETLACGGFMASLAERGVPVRVLAVTDGEASHPGSSGLAEIRRAEQERALHALGVTTPPIRVGLPDGRVTDHEDALAELIEEHCGDADVIVAPWRLDGHCDHDATGRAALVAGRRTGRRVLAYPVWAWQWASVADLERAPWRRVDLDAHAQARKSAAIEQFATQITDRLGPPVVDAAALVRFRRSSEVLADVG